MRISKRLAAWFILGATATALVMAVVYALLQGAQYAQSGAATADAIRQTQVSNHALLRTIQDCTQPTGKCFRDGQHRTAGAVSDIDRVVVLAAACAVGRSGPEPQVEAAIQQCVIDRLARGDR